MTGVVFALFLIAVMYLTYGIASGDVVQIVWSLFAALLTGAAVVWRVTAP